MMTGAVGNTAEDQVGGHYKTQLLTKCSLLCCFLIVEASTDNFSFFFDVATKVAGNTQRSKKG